LLNNQKSCDKRNIYLGLPNTLYLSTTTFIFGVKFKYKFHLIQTGNNNNGLVKDQKYLI